MFFSGSELRNRTPKVVRSVSRNDPVLLDAQAEPEVLRLEIRGQSKAAFEVGHVETIGREAVDGREEMPSVGRGFFLFRPARSASQHKHEQVSLWRDLEVVTERPVPEHLEEGVVVGILSHVVQVLFNPSRQLLNPCRCVESRSPLCFPPARMHFWLLTARLSLEKGDEGSTVPRKMDLYWFILWKKQAHQRGALSGRECELRWASGCAFPPGSTVRQLLPLLRVSPLVRSREFDPTLQLSLERSCDVPSVGEEEGGILVRDCARARDKGVLCSFCVLEVVEIGLSNLVGRPVSPL